MNNNIILVIVVSRRLEHARPRITLDVYGYLIPTKQQEVASLMDQLASPFVEMSKSINKPRTECRVNPVESMIMPVIESRMLNKA